MRRAPAPPGQRRSALALVASIGILWVAPTARPQEPPPPPTQASDPYGDPPRRGPHRPERAQREFRHGWDQGSPESRPCPPWGRPIFEPSEQDRGPLRPGEEEELRAFVQKDLPRMARLLQHVEEQNSGAWRQGFPRLVPRLRLLRRIHAEDPELAQLIEQHAGNLFRVELLRRSWTRAAGETRDLLERQMREHLAANVDIEAAALNRWADNLQTNREQRIASRLARLKESTEELAAEPEDVRDRVTELAATTDAARVQALTEEVTARLGRHLDSLVASVRKRAAELRENAGAEVDRRLARLLSAPPFPGRPHP